MNESQMAELIKEAQGRSADGRSAVEVVRWLHIELAERLGNSYGAHTLTYALHTAFDLDFLTVRRAMGWAGLGWGGPKSDAELESLLGELVPRTGKKR